MLPKLDVSAATRLRMALLILAPLACQERPSGAERHEPEPTSVTTLSSATVRKQVATVTSEEASRLQGIWVVRDADYVGSRQAWDVHGDLVSVHDAGHRWDAQEHIRVLSPCSLVRSRPLPNGEEIETTDTFALAPDGLHVALERVAGGALRDGLITACVDGHVYSYDEVTKTCGRWDAEMTSLFRSTGDECALKQGPTAQTFVLSPFGGGASTRFDVQGEALLSLALEALVAEPEPSWTAAVARADQLAKP